LIIIVLECSRSGWAPVSATKRQTHHDDTHV
jgi:hypothetical protein